MHHWFVFIAAAALLSSEAGFARAQIKVGEGDSIVRYGSAQETRYRVGFTLEAKRGAVSKVFATVPVPLACPEQEVTLIEEDFTDTVRAHDYRMLQGNNARQLLVNIPFLPDKAEARAVLTFKVRTRVILPPEDTSELFIPKKPPREIKRYLAKSPFIETNHSKFKKIARGIFTKLEKPTDEPGRQTDGESASADVETTPKPLLTDWQRVEAIYNHVQDSIQYQEQDDKSALATLKDGHGDCQNISALFVALCRTSKVPARLVWVHQHVYSEFCLADGEGKLHWFPCETSGGSAVGGASGVRAFGEMPIPRVIMQKGDNFKVPEKRKSLRYAAEYMTAEPAQAGSGKPTHKFIREQL